MKKSITSSLFGLAMLVGALAIIGRLAGWWQGELDGWWTVFLIVPGIAGIITYGFNAWYSILTLVGVWLLADCQGWLANLPSKEILYIIVLAVFGLWLIFKPFRKQKNFHGAIPTPIETVSASSDEYPTSTAVFSESEINCTDTVKGGKFTAVFGSVEVDLSNAFVQEGAVINATSIFGGIQIKTGGKFRVILQGVPIFGGASDESSGKLNPNLPAVYIKYTAVFGGVEIK